MSRRVRAGSVGGRNGRDDGTLVDPEDTAAVLRALPKAELHLHLEGSIRPRTAAVVRRVVRWSGMGVIGFGMGGDEMAFDYRQFRPAFELAAEHGLHRTAHAGEVGPPQKVRDAIELFGAERVGHGIATMQDPALAELVIERLIALEICPTSNLCTGALARQVGTPHPTLADHPLKGLLAAGVPATLSTDDPAMFHTDLVSEYANCTSLLGLSTADTLALAEASFHHAFLPASEKQALVERFRTKAVAVPV